MKKNKHRDPEYEAALALPSHEDKVKRLKELATQLDHPVRRYAVVCAYPIPKKPPKFGHLQPDGAAIVQLFLSTGCYDVALARVIRKSGCLIVTQRQLHPRSSTPQPVAFYTMSAWIAHWSGEARCGAVVVLVWPKMLRLHLLGLRRVFHYLGKEHGFDRVAGLVSTGTSALDLLVHLVDTTTGAPPDAKMYLVSRLADTTRQHSAKLCAKFLSHSMASDPGIEYFVFRAMANHGWERLEGAFIRMLELSWDHALFLHVVSFVLKVVGLEGHEWADDATRLRHQPRFDEFIQHLYAHCFCYAAFLARNVALTDAVRVPLFVNLLRFEAAMSATNWVRTPRFSTELDANHAFFVTIYDPQSLHEVMDACMRHPSYSPVNVVAPALLQTDFFPESLDAYFDCSIAWLYNAGSDATANGLASFLRLLVMYDRLDGMHSVWSQVGVVVPAILHVATTTIQPLDAKTLAVFDTAVGLNCANFVLSLPNDSVDLASLCRELLQTDLEAGILIGLQHHIMVHAVAYLNHDAQHPRTLPYDTVRTLYHRCDSPTVAWVLAPLVWSLPNGIEKREFALKCIDLLTQAQDIDPFVGVHRWYEAIEQLRNVVGS